jgi:hypothetical protein
MSEPSQVVFDWQKVTHIHFRWRAAGGLFRSKKPRKPTVNGCQFDTEAIAPEITRPDGVVYPREKMIDRARRKNTLDVWVPSCVVYLSAGRNLSFNGRKAQRIWKEWNRRQFNNEHTNRNTNKAAKGKTRATNRDAATAAVG